MSKGPAILRATAVFSGFEYFRVKPRVELFKFLIFPAWFIKEYEDFQILQLI